MNPADSVPTLPAVLAVVLYMVIGTSLGRLYYRRRHGVRLGTGWGAFDSGSLRVFALTFVWPIAVFVPTLRDPELCLHQHHVLERARARRSHEAHHEALRSALDEERGNR